jgi:DNA-binding transcriptional LysR family regulator
MSLEELAKAKLLHLEQIGERWYDWPTWFAAAGMRPPLLPRMTAFDSYTPLISAALAGQGVALCWSGLLDEYLSAGALVPVSHLQLTSDRGYFATYSLDLEPDSVVARIAGWMASEGQARIDAPVGGESPSR